MKQFYITLIFIGFTNLMVGQSFDMSLSLLGTNDDTGNYEVALIGTPNFTEANGNSADIGAVVSITDNIYLLPSGFVNECTTSGPPLFETTCEYPIEKEEWTADFLTDPSDNSSGRYVYQLLRTETGEATFFDAVDGTPVVLAVFEIYNTVSGLPTTGDITLIDNNDAILDGTPNASFFNIRYTTATSGATTDLYNVHDSSANTVSFGTLSTGRNELLDVSLSPNPTEDKFHIDGLLEPATLSVYDLKGRLVLTKPDYLNTFVDVSKLKSAIYLVKLSTENGGKTIKLIKE